MTEFVPMPPFMLKRNVQFEFKYANQYLLEEPLDMLAIPLNHRQLASPIPVESASGINRDIWSEAYLPFHVFEKFGVSQPAWFSIQADNENPNDDNPKRKMYSNIPHHVCLAYIHPDSVNLQPSQQEKMIELSPTLSHYFRKCNEVWISPLITGNQKQSVNDFLSIPLSLSADGGIMPLRSITLEYVHGEANEETLLEFFKTNPKVLQMGDFVI